VERVILPDACLALDYILDMTTYIVRGMRVNAERMRENMDASYGLAYSQRVLLALIDKGMNRQEAYKIVQGNAMKAWEARSPYFDFLAADERVTSKLSRSELEGLFEAKWYLRYVDDSFKRLGM
jgi:adenylosuccinate lyase